MTTPTPTSSSDKSKSSASTLSANTGGNGAATSAALPHIPDLSGASSIFSAVGEAAAPDAHAVNSAANRVAAAASPGTASAYDSSRYRLVPKGDWPPPIYIDPNATEQERHYIEYRWYSQWAWYDKRASEAKKHYQRLQIMVGIGSLIVPALISFVPPDSWLQALPGVDDTIRVATVLISLMVGAIAVLENVNKYGDNWRNFRGAAEELLREKSLYDVRSGPYRKTKNPFLLFVQRSEEIMTKQNGTFLQLAEEVQQQGQAQGQQGVQNPVAARSTYSSYSSIDSSSSEGFVDDIVSTTSTTTNYSTTTSTAAPAATSDADVKG